MGVVLLLFLLLAGAGLSGREGMCLSANRGGLKDNSINTLFSLSVRLTLTRWRLVRSQPSAAAASPVEYLRSVGRGPMWLPSLAAPDVSRWLFLRLG